MLDLRAIQGGPAAEGRSRHWPRIRQEWVSLNPECAACGAKPGPFRRLLGRANDVHHVIPFHIRPNLELDPSNLITLCRGHHLYVGHNGNWKLWNPRVREDAARLRGQG